MLPFEREVEQKINHRKCGKYDGNPFKVATNTEANGRAQYRRYEDYRSQYAQDN